MKYANFNNLGLSDEQVDAIKDCISNHIACGMATIVDYSSCRLADEGEDAVAISDDELCCVPAGCEPNKSYQMTLKNGGLEPAKIQVDMTKWQQSKYPAEVKELSDIGPGVLSWVSTVEDVAKRSAVNVKGVLVKPAKLRIPPYQRKFAWKEQNVRQLCKDLLKAGDKTNYHLGTVILHHECKNG